MIYAISDLHFSLAKPKPMDVFGESWYAHFQRICEDWSKRITEDDVVLIAGDISWAMNYSEAKVDLDAIGVLSGKKIMIRGNHDYWHASPKKTRAVLPESCFFLQNDCVCFEGIAFAGTRGWKQPCEPDFSAEDKKIFERELIRLEMTLTSARKTGLPIIAMMHFPPFEFGRKPSGFTELFSKFGVKTVVYGHIHHGKSLPGEFAPFNLGGVQYVLTACDFLDFRPILIQ